MFCFSFAAFAPFHFILCDENLLTLIFVTPANGNLSYSYYNEMSFIIREGREKCSTWNISPGPPLSYAVSLILNSGSKAFRR